MYDSFTSPEFRQAVTLAKFQGWCDRINSGLGPLKSKELSRLDTNTLQGTVVCAAVYQGHFARGTGTIAAIFQHVDDQWLLLRMNVNSPQVLDNPADYRERLEVLVDESDAVMPGESVDVVDVSTQPPQVIVENVPVAYVRWRLAGPDAQLGPAASGFVTLVLTTSQDQAVLAANKLAVRRHEDSPSATAEEVDAAE